MHTPNEKFFKKNRCTGEIVRHSGFCCSALVGAVELQRILEQTFFRLQQIFHNAGGVVAAVLGDRQKQVVVFPVLAVGVGAVEVVAQQLLIEPAQKGLVNVIKQGVVALFGDFQVEFLVVLNERLLVQVGAFPGLFDFQQAVQVGGGAPLRGVPGEIMRVSTISDSRAALIRS